MAWKAAVLPLLARRWMLSSTTTRSAPLGAAASAARREYSSRDTACASGSTESSEMETGGFQFAAATSHEESLSRAVVECAGQLHAKLGAMPDLLHLLVSVDTHADNIHLAPQFLLECMTGSWSDKVPALIGGGVRQVIGRGSEGKGKGPGVTVMGAVLPGVKVTPFHTPSATIPDLPGDTWRRILLPSEGQSTAAILLSEPHFRDVQTLLRRIVNVAPHTQVMGGVMEPGVSTTAAAESTASMISAIRKGMAAGAEHLGHGALFMGADTFHEGAVGCFLQGAFQLDLHHLPGCRPVGRQAIVTSSDGALLLELDGQPAIDKFMQMVEELSEEEKELPLFMGVKDPESRVDGEGEGCDFAVRLFRMDSPPGVLLSSVDVPEGSAVQLHGRDAQWATQLSREDLIVEADDAKDAGAFVYSCVAAQHIGADGLSHAVGSAVEMSGGFCQGEFVRLGGSNATTSLTSSSTIVGVLGPPRASLASEGRK